MTTADGMQPVVVNVGPCRCIGGADTLHPKGDEVYLAPEASMTLGLRSNGAIAVSEDNPARLEAMLGRVFIEEGITGWTFTEASQIVKDGKITESRDPVPVTPATIERWLPWARGGALVSERANDLYSEAVLSPLRARFLLAQKRGPTSVLTSVTRPSRRQRLNSSKSSSPAPSEMPA
jgi:hypothetical protein